MHCFVCSIISSCICFIFYATKMSLLKTLLWFSNQYSKSTSKCTKCLKQSAFMCKLEVLSDFTNNNPPWENQYTLTLNLLKRSLVKVMTHFHVLIIFHYKYDQNRIYLTQSDWTCSNSETEDSTKKANII